MSIATFGEFRQQFFQLYYQKDYAQALELVQQAMTQLPLDWRIHNWRMSVEARLNQPAQAIQTFREALKHGYWCDPAIMRGDPDLESLDGLEEYEQLMAECQRQFDAAQKDIKPELVVLPPEQGAKQPTPLAIALHGNTGSAQDSVPDWQYLATKGWRVALPHSSQLVASNAAVWNDPPRGTAEVQAHYAALAEQYAIDPDRVIIGGFSAGGGLAIRLAVSGAVKARGFIVVGPYLRDLDSLTPFLETAKASGVRGYMVMGLQEPPEGQELMRQTADLLNSHGVLCLVEQRPDLAHVFPPDFDLSLEKALAFIFPEDKH